MQRWPGLRTSLECGAEDQRHPHLAILLRYAVRLRHAQGPRDNDVRILGGGEGSGFIHPSSALWIDQPIPTTLRAWGLGDSRYPYNATCTAAT